jgi:RNA polymerase sigma factor (sigma-70 family)
MIFLGLMSTDQAKLNRKEKISIDERLFAQIAIGNYDALESLYCSTDKAVFGYVLSILGNKQDAEDVMQETYIRIRAAAHLYQPKGKPLAWIFTIAKNLCLIKLRTNRKIRYSSYEELEDHPDFSVCTNYEDRIVLEKAFQILREDERKIIILHAITGLKHREIAEILEIPLSTVLSKYTRGLNKLKRHLT